MSTKEISSVVLKYFKESFRPYSANDIVERYGKEYGKSAILKSIDNLVSEGSIIAKIFGKQKIYYFKDDEYNKKNPTDIAAMEKKLQKLNYELKIMDEEIQRYGNELKELNKLSTIQELEIEREKLNYKIGANIEKLDRIKYLQSSQKTLLLPEDIIKIENYHEKISSTYRKRKRICSEIIDAIMEGYPKTKKRLIDEVGIETDESVGFKLINNK